MSHWNVVRGPAAEGPLARPAQISAAEAQGVKAVLNGRRALGRCAARPGQYVRVDVEVDGVRHWRT